MVKVQQGNLSHRWTEDGSFGDWESAPPRAAVLSYVRIRLPVTDDGGLVSQLFASICLILAAEPDTRTRMYRPSQAVALIDCVCPDQRFIFFKASCSLFSS